MSDLDFVQLVQPDFERWESRSPWFYLDAPGHLTIGIGHLVAKRGASEQELRKAIQNLLSYGFDNVRTDAKFAREYAGYCATTPRRQVGPVRARQLESVRSLLYRIDPVSGRVNGTSHDPNLVPGVWGVDLPPSSGDPANLPVLLAEAKNVANYKSTLFKRWNHYPAIQFFECFNSYRMTDDGIDALFYADVSRKLKELRRSKRPELNNFDTYPLPVRRAMIDIAFQGWSQATQFYQAVAARNWAAAAKVSPFPDEKFAQPERTEFRKALLREAAAPAVPPPRDPGLLRDTRTYWV